ncbi:MAG: hypothetical protein KBI12_01600 [Methanothrix sp.]|nr:hypothetical protein [Methanothrix sp.]
MLLASWKCRIRHGQPGCEWAGKIDPANRIWFNSSQEAKSHGYVPCKACSPP